MTRIEEIDLEIEEVYKELEKLDDFSLEKTYEEFEERREPFNKKLSGLSIEKRLLMIPKFSEIPDYGDVMHLKNLLLA